MTVFWIRTYVLKQFFVTKDSPTSFLPSRVSDTKIRVRMRYNYFKIIHALRVLNVTDYLPKRNRVL